MRDPRLSEIGTLFTVESGCYSDHSIHAVFANRSDAEAWVAAMAIIDDDRIIDDYRVGTILMVPPGMAPFKVAVCNTTVTLWDDGKVQRRGAPRVSIDWAIERWHDVPEAPKVRAVRAPYLHNKGCDLQVMASSLEALEKVIADRIAMWKAGAWSTRGPAGEMVVPL